MRSPRLSLVPFLVAPRAVTRSCLSPPCASGHRAPQAVSARLDAVPTTWCLSQNDQPVPFPNSTGHLSVLVLCFRARPCPTAAPVPQNRRRQWITRQRLSADRRFSPLNPPVQPEHGPILLPSPCSAARRGSGRGYRNVPPAAPVPGGCQRQPLSQWITTSTAGVCNLQRPGQAVGGLQNGSKDLVQDL